MRIAILGMKYLRIRGRLYTITNETLSRSLRGRLLLKVRRGNTIFPVVFPVGGASPVAFAPESRAQTPPIREKTIERFLGCAESASLAFGYISQSDCRMNSQRVTSA